MDSVHESVLESVDPEADVPYEFCPVAPMPRRHGNDNPDPQPQPASKRERCDIDLFDQEAGPNLVAALSIPPTEQLNSKVLVLNRLYVAVRVVSARRAFCLLMRDIAEVIDVQSGKASGAAATPNAEVVDVGDQYFTYDFATWASIAALQPRFEKARYDWVRTPRLEIPVPRIIRLLGYDRLPEQTVKLNRRNLFARDRNTCQYCGRHFPTADLSIDHVLPRTQGGKDTWENLVCACIRCNARKGGRTPPQAHMKLVRPPERPKRNPIITLRLGHEKYRSWKTFLDHAYWDVELK